jgi:hypothetical protein
MTRLLLLGLVGAGCGCGWAATPADPPAKTNPPAFAAELKDAAAKYTSWGRVDDLSRWAPELCRIPPPPQARFSASKDEGTHGKKLYSVFAKDRHAYARIARLKESKVGQVVVKQSWLPEEVTGKEADDARAAAEKIAKELPAGRDFNPYAIRDGKVYKASKQGDLFVMLKLDPATPNTDTGWVYGTVTSDGKTVTSGGRVESCMKCHTEAKTDRLFGLYPEKASDR